MSFFFNDTATTEIYTLSLHDALPISHRGRHARHPRAEAPMPERMSVRTTPLCARAFAPFDPSAGNGPAASSGIGSPALAVEDRKSTRLNSSHANISYAVFCLKKKKHN